MRLRKVDYIYIQDELKKTLKQGETVEYYNCYSKRVKKDIITTISLRLKDRGYTLQEIANIINSLGYRTPTQGKEFCVYTIHRYIQYRMRE